MFAAERTAESAAQRHGREMLRLEAALAGAEAARCELAQHAAAERPAGERASCAGCAEAAARAAALQSQVDTLRAHAAAAQAGLKDEAQGLKVCPALLGMQAHFECEGQVVKFQMINVWFLSCCPAPGSCC